jgi:outer membrane biosynthesis protein TonB
MIDPSATVTEGGGRRSSYLMACSLALHAPPEQEPEPPPPEYEPEPAPDPIGDPPMPQPHQPEPVELPPASPPEQQPQMHAIVQRAKWFTARPILSAA